MNGLPTNLLKLGMAAAIILWLVHSGRLDLRAIEHSWSKWPRLCIIAAVFYLQFVILSLRWRILAQGLALDLSRKSAFSLTMTGMLFNTVVPGSVGGDVLKAYYARGSSSNQTGAVASIVVDRVIGLFSLVLLAVIGAAWSYPQLSRNTDLRAFWIVLIGILLFGTGIGIAVMAASEHLASIVIQSRILPPMRIVLLKLLHVFSSYNRKRGVLLQSVALSLPCHLLACGAFYLSWAAVSQTMPDPRVLLFVVPLGLVTTAVPLAPGGIGVGQAAFFTLFEFVLQDRGAVGSAAFTIYQMVLLLVSCSGVIFYMRVRKIIIPQVAVTDDSHEAGLLVIRPPV